MVKLMEIDYINGPRTDKIFGMSKYQMEIFRRIEGVDWNIIEYTSLMQLTEKRYKDNLNSIPDPKNFGDKSSSKNKIPNSFVDIG